MMAKVEKAKGKKQKSKKAKTDKKNAETKSKSKQVKDPKKRTKGKGGDIEQRKKKTMKRVKRTQRKRSFKKKRGRRKKKREFDVRLVSIRRVSKVTSGAKRLRLSVMAVIGDRKGKIGVGVAKGIDVRDAQEKAINKAKKKMFKVPMKGQTIPHEITQKYGAAKVFLKPAAPGTGVIAGGAVRAVAEVAGIQDILSKVLGSKNKIANVYATIEAFKNLKLKRA